MAKQKLTVDEVRHVAKLANLPLTPDEIKKYAPQLSAIVDFVSKLQVYDTKKVKPTSQVTGLINVFREDQIEATRMLTQEEALSNARQKHNGYFVVPAIFE